MGQIDSKWYKYVTFSNQANDIFPYGDNLTLFWPKFDIPEMNTAVRAMTRSLGSVLRKNTRCIEAWMAWNHVQKALLLVEVWWLCIVIVRSWIITHLLFVIFISSVMEHKVEFICWLICCISKHFLRKKATFLNFSGTSEQCVNIYIYIF